MDFEFESGCRKWVPDPLGTIYHESYTLRIPPELRPGKYRIKIKLYSKEEEQDVFLALDPNLLDDQNFYTVASMNISSPEK
jgi:hypothetical protein